MRRDIEMFEREFVQSGHTTRLSVQPADGDGWEVRIEQDSRVVRRAHYTDWHRVERAVLAMSVDASDAGPRQGSTNR